MQAEQLAKHLQLEQQKAEQDRAKWERNEAELQHSLQETLSSSQQLQDAKESVEQEHSDLQELHRQVMAELEQRNGQVQRLQAACTYLLHTWMLCEKVFQMHVRLGHVSSKPP